MGLGTDIHRRKTLAMPQVQAARSPKTPTVRSTHDAKLHSIWVSMSQNPLERRQRCAMITDHFLPAVSLTAVKLRREQTVRDLDLGHTMRSVEWGNLRLRSRSNALSRNDPEMIRNSPGRSSNHETTQQKERRCTPHHTDL